MKITAGKRQQFKTFSTFLMAHPCQILTYLCLLEISSALGFHPQGTRRRLSRRLSTVTEFRCTTWNPGAIPPRCLSLEKTKNNVKVNDEQDSTAKKQRIVLIPEDTLHYSLLSGVTETVTVKLGLPTHFSGYFGYINSQKKETWFQEVISTINELSHKTIMVYFNCKNIAKKVQRLPLQLVQEHLCNYCVPQSRLERSQYCFIILIGNSIRHIYACLVLVWSHGVCYLWRNVSSQATGQRFHHLVCKCFLDSNCLR